MKKSAKSNQRKYFANAKNDLHIATLSQDNEDVAPFFFFEKMSLKKHCTIVTEPKVALELASGHAGGQRKVEFVKDAQKVYVYVLLLLS